MSTIKNNPLLKGASGMLGNVVVYREYRGKIVMANRPKRPDKLSGPAQAVRERFLLAVQYGKAQQSDPVSRAEYEASMGKRFSSVYSAAVADFLKAPELKSVDTTGYRGQVGDLIVIGAVDDFKVTSVSVSIADGNGVTVEQGQAVLRPGSLSLWDYACTVNHASLPGSKVTVRVADKPGNVTVGEVTL